MQSVTRGPVDQTRTEIAFLLLGTKRNLAKVGDALPTTSDKSSGKGMTMKSNIMDVDGVIHHITEKAILFSTDGVKDNAVWLPKSMIECDEELGLTSIQIPEQFAIDKELI